jgi:hypothetical protein
VEETGGLARGSEPARDHAGVVDEASVLVDHEHAAQGMRGRREGSHERAVGAGERDRLGDDGRPLLYRTVITRRSPARAVATVRAVRAGLRGRHGQQRRGCGRAEAEQPEAPHRLSPGDDPVGVVLSDLLGQVTLDLRHLLPPGCSDGPPVQASALWQRPHSYALVESGSLTLDARRATASARSAHGRRQPCSARFPSERADSLDDPGATRPLNGQTARVRRRATVR